MGNHHGRKSKNKKEMKRSNSAIPFRNYEEKKAIQKELTKFQNIFPCLLKANSNGEIEYFNSCLKEIPKYRIQFNEENKFSANECQISSSIIDNIDYSIAISVLLNDSKFKLLSNDSKNIELIFSSKSIVVKKKIYSISIKEEDICINNNYKQKLESIANNKELRVNQKAEKLDELLKDAGFLVPLKAYIGGLYTFNCEKISDNIKKELLSNLKLDLNIGNFGFKGNLGDMKKKYEESRISTQINRFQIGGNTNKPFKDWLESVDLKNSHIIEYTELRRIDSFIDDNIKAKLEKPIALVLAKYKRRYNYLKVLDELRKTKGLHKYFKLHNFKCGICDKRIQDIYVDNTCSFYLDSKILTCVTKDIFKSFPYIIVGIEIINQCEKHEYGYFSITNPILKKELSANFESARGEFLKFDINIYLMRVPE